MHRRAYISIVAAISLLVHAGFVARHDFLMSAQAVEFQDFLIGRIAICHSGDTQPFGGLDPASNSPSNQQKNSCPICLGFGPVVAALGGDAGEIAPPSIVLALYRSTAKAAAILGHDIDVPPSRGPPAFA